MKKHTKKVLVGLSGGVDSSVAAALLVDQGYDVTGIMLKLWSVPGTEDENRCCTDESFRRSQQVAEKLGIPLHLIDSREAFFSSVVKRFIDSYASGRTPNPCICCNQFVKWTYLLDQAEAQGAGYIATGHYARIVQAHDRSYQLFKAADLSKDQSYVLALLNQEQLSKTLLPLGGMRKSDVRQVAAKMGFDSADQPDSQDLCFVGQNDYRAFINTYSPQSLTEGDIVDQKGNILGRHNGLFEYTIGQRKGIKVAAERPYYVIEKDVANNRLVVGHREEMGRTSLFVHNFHWISGLPPALDETYQFKIRYNSQSTPGLIQIHATGTTEIDFKQPVLDVTPGQLVVCYSGDQALGGGFIDG